MNIEKYTDRARGFIQSAQSLALREGHQQFTPEHVLKVLLDDPEGLAAGLIDRSGGNLESVDENRGIPPFPPPVRFLHVGTADAPMRSANPGAAVWARGSE